MYCIKCGKQNDSNNKFCIACGKELKSILNSPDATTCIDQISSMSSDPWGKPEAQAKPTLSGLGSDTSTTVLGTSCLTLRSSKKSIIVDNLPATIGKGSAADCIIAGDEAISRVHAKIAEYGQQGFVIEDLNSTNRTYLNGNVITTGEQVVLNNGDKLKLGQTTFTVEI